MKQAVHCELVPGDHAHCNGHFTATHSPSARLYYQNHSKSNPYAHGHYPGRHENPRQDDNPRQENHVHHVTDTTPRDPDALFPPHEHYPNRGPRSVRQTFAQNPYLTILWRIPSYVKLTCVAILACTLYCAANGLNLLAVALMIALLCCLYVSIEHTARTTVGSARHGTPQWG